ncbi:hypothetical protein G6549_22320 [Bacillus sp. MM2020_1]|nr:hypothetical protein [Bacillus sp. MM2020_1]
MNHWIIITPEGITTSPTDVMNDNFQVLGFVDAISEVDAVEKLKQEYQYLNGSGFDEVWIYQIRNSRPLITFLEKERSGTNYEIEDGMEREIVEKITNILIQIGYSDLVYDYCSDDSYHFEGYSDAFQEIRVDVEGEKIEVYDRYLGEKHFVYSGNFKLN